MTTQTHLHDTENDPTERQQWMAVLSRADGQALKKSWKALSNAPAWEYLRRPETGLVMVRGRMGGTGRRFNLGEMTLTRCAVRLITMNITGFGYVAGYAHEHAMLAALFDALLQDQSHHQQVMETLITPEAERIAQARERKSRQAAATRASFFTLERGHIGI
ncbi:MAG: phosphonate C-P lyase system protein PhnG [Oceanidesulfovibrio sp.]